MPLKRSRLRVVSLALATVLLPACTTWQAATAGPTTVIPRDRPSSVRVTLADGTTTTVPSPTLRNDSIVSRDFRRAGGVPTSEVSRMEVQRVSIGRTLGLAAAGVVAAAAWTVAVTGSGGTPEDPGPLPKFAPAILQGIGWIGGLIP